MKHPEDIFIGPDEMIYVADTENNRVLVMTLEGEVVEEITTSGGKKLNKPRGVYVDDDLSVWIADTGNLRLTVLNADRTHRRDFVKPDSALLENNFTFDVQKLFVADTGYIYVLKGANLIALDEGNNFRGYLGADDVGFSLSRTLIRMFGSKTQVERTVKQEPASYSNFFIGPDGMIYGILSNKNTAQIRKLNSVGNNTYPEEKYGFTLTDKEGKPLEPTMADITVEDNGIITVVDRITGLIYQYDQEGNLLCTFGGIGTVGGLFQIPVSIDADSQGRLYVLDYNTGSITVFAPTHFIGLVHEAVRLHGEGRYEEALVYWQQALEIDSNYALAHQGVAKVMGKQERWEESLNSYYLADDKEGYSEAFGEYRHELFRQYFVPVVAVIFIGGFLLVKLLGLAKKYADKWADDVQMRRGL
ncbi:MAG: tetratricopeptide repeat protein [Clostridia bacterium]|nr:tetratricopeptide repeat protein [Clostridia bacterium]